MNEQLIQYIKKNLEVGYSQEAIFNALLRGGYDADTSRQHMSFVINQRGYNAAIQNKNVQGANVKNYETYNAKPKSSSAKILTITLIIILISVVAFFYFTNDMKVEGAIETNEPDYELDLLNKALIEHDPLICEQITDAAVKEQCKKSLLPESNEPCDEKCEDTNLLNKALIDRDEKECAGIKNKAVKESCISNFNKTQAEKECNSECQDRNTLNLAIINQDGSLCSQINDSAMKNQCLIMLKKEVEEDGNEEGQT